MRSNTAIVILAAGKGTRLRSSRAKVLHEAGGLRLAEHVLRAAKPLKAGIWVVVGHQAEAVASLAKEYGASTVVQRPQRGTGHAVQVALKALPRSVRQIVVLPGDGPLITPATLRALLREHRRTRAAATVLSAELADPRGYGRIVRTQAGDVAGIVEQSALRGSQREIAEANSGVYAFDSGKLRNVLGRLTRSNIHRELYLTDAIALLHAGGGKVSAWVAPDSEEVLGANTRSELAYVDAVLRWRKVEAVMESGVTVLRPDTQIIDPDVKVGLDTVIEMGTQIIGATRIGKNCRIGAGCVLVNARLADDVTLRPYSLVFNSRLGKGVAVGPFAHLRDGADIRAGASIGNYVEVKKSVVGEGAKAQHLTYLGDSSVGAGTNIGAGTITCNYDGVNKNPTRIGRNVFVGSGTMLVAPVRVGDGAYVAAGSVITDDVPVHGLGIARGRQVNRPGWARTRAQKLAAAKARKEESAVEVKIGPIPGGTTATRRVKKKQGRKKRKSSRR